MMLDHANKVAVFFTTRTGSTTLEKVLTDWGLESVWPKHLTPDEMRLFWPQIEDYELWGVYRDPVERLRSGLRYLQQARHYALLMAEWHRVPVEDWELYPYERVMERLPEYALRVNPLFRAQRDWLAGAHKIIRYEDYDRGVLRLAQRLGQKRVSIPQLNATHRAVPHAPEAVHRFAAKYYEQDYQLQESKRESFV